MKKLIFLLILPTLAFCAIATIFLEDLAAGLMAGGLMEIFFLMFFALIRAAFEKPPEEQKQISEEEFLKTLSEGMT